MKTSTKAPSLLHNQSLARDPGFLHEDGEDTDSYYDTTVKKNR